MNRLAPLRSRKGFTLVEILVAMTVLALMMTGLAAIMSFVSKTWLAGINIVDNFSKARVMLNLLDRDIQQMVMRRDVAAFVDASGNPACAFYTRVQGNQGSATTDPRNLSLVQYALNPLSSPSSTSVLQRTELGLFFTGGTMSMGYPLPSPATLPTTTFTGTSQANQTENVGNGVIAFQWQFVDGTGAIQSNSGSTNAYSYTFTYPAAPANSRAVIVSLLVMSNNAYTFAGNTGNLVTLSGLFPTTNPSGQTYAQVWNAILNGSSPAYSALPAPLRASGSILVFQRYIPLPITAPSSSS